MGLNEPEYYDCAAVPVRPQPVTIERWRRFPGAELWEFYPTGAPGEPAYGSVFKSGVGYRYVIRADRYFGVPLVSRGAWGKMRDAATVLMQCYDAEGQK